MGVLTIRNVDDDVITALKARARANHRSLEGELRYLLSRYADPRPGLGAVRERARMAASYQATPNVSGDAAPAAAEIADTCPDDQVPEPEWMGAMRDVGEIVGDIVSPATDPAVWDALRPKAARPRDVDDP